MNQKKILTYAEALERAQKYCVYQERCQSEVRYKLYELGVNTKEAESIIAELITDNFINEERFAKTFAAGKFRMKQWGLVKIKNELRKRKLSEFCIASGLKEIVQEEYTKTLEILLLKKAKLIKKTADYILRNRLATYAISKGYEHDLVWKTLEKLKF